MKDSAAGFSRRFYFCNIELQSKASHTSPIILRSGASCLFRFTFSVKPQEAILILITMFWGGTFLAVQYAVTLSDPFFFVGLRFATAAIAVGLIR